MCSVILLGVGAGACKWCVLCPFKYKVFVNGVSQVFVNGSVISNICSSHLVCSKVPYGFPSFI